MKSIVPDGAMRFIIAIIILTMKDFSGEGRAARGGTPL